MNNGDMTVIAEFIFQRVLTSCGEIMTRQQMSGERCMATLHSHELTHGLNFDLFVERTIFLLLTLAIFVFNFTGEFSYSHVKTFFMNIV